jgi:5S rRNA maturation endonuclease (ribonuclease M5)
VTVGVLLDRLERVKRAGKGWEACCPAHEDRNPSLSISVGDDGRVLLFCHAGCSVDAIVAKLGLSLSDLFVESSNGPGVDRGVDSWSPRGPIVTRYPYVDGDGRLRYEVCRTADKEFPQRRPDPSSKTGWRWNLDGVERLLYRLPEVIAAVAAGKTVHVVEGEKDVDALRARGYVATCNPGGVGKWSDDYAKVLAGANVVVIADRDAKGVEHAKHVARSLERVGAFVTLRQAAVVTEKADVSDHLAAGYSLEELVPLVADDDNPFFAGDSPVPPSDDASIAVVEFVPVEQFVAHPVPQAEPIVVDASGSTAIAANGLGLTYGDGGAGKTTLWLDAAMHFVAGDPWLDGLLTPTRKLNVGWVENEGPQEEFRRKLERKLDAWRGRLPASSLHVLKAPWGALDLRLAEHRDGLAAAVRVLDLDLLVVGPLNDLGMEGGGTPDEVRAFHAYLKDVQSLAARLVSLMVLHHENTAGRVSGAWTGRPDLLVHVTAQGNGKTRVLWQKAKWSSSLHRTTSQLRWAEHEGFEPAEAEPGRPERVWEGIEAYVLEHGGTGWNDVEKAVSGQGDYLRRRREQMLADGLIVNLGTGQKFSLWHRDDPARPPTLETTVSKQGHGGDTVASATGDVREHATASARPVRSRDAVTDAVGSASPDPVEPTDDEIIT